MNARSNNAQFSMALDKIMMSELDDLLEGRWRSAWIADAIAARMAKELVPKMTDECLRTAQKANIEESICILKHERKYLPEIEREMRKRGMENDIVEKFYGPVEPCNCGGE